MTGLETVSIDGSFGEGGGQILRTSVSLAAFTGKTLELTNIRARRSKPGLHAQHLTSVLAAAKLCNAYLEGAALHSQRLLFVPSALSYSKEFNFEVGTAGSTGLIAQTMLVPSLFLPNAPSKAFLRGGTHVPMAPNSDYIEAVYLPLLRRMGAEVEFSSQRAGFFPKGGGEIEFQVAGSLKSPINLIERGQLTSLNVITTTSLLPEHVAERGEIALSKELRGYGVPVKFERRDLKSTGPGAAVLVVAECENGIAGFSSLGERGRPMERVAADALKAFQKWFASGCATDEHLADQLVLPCSLIPEESAWNTSEVTEHLRTVLFVAKQFLPEMRYELSENADGSGEVRVTGEKKSSF